MIRYDAASAGRLEAAVRRDVPTWERRAKLRSAKISKAGEYSEKTSIWSEVKATFMRLQHSKCAFCERKFEDPQYSAIEFDIEHFRPKGTVVAWPDPVRHAKLTYEFPTGGTHPRGYYWLAYDLKNYAVACKVCNTILKLNFFPIAGQRGAPLSTVANLAAEHPLLCYPIGDIDDDPEGLITFEATTAVPVQQADYLRERATVTIDFFELNLRDQLHRERAQLISLFAPALRAVSDGTASKEDQAVAARMGDSRLPHAACVRAFKRTWQADRLLAERIATACKAFWVSDEGTRPPNV